MTMLGSWFSYDGDGVQVVRQATCLCGAPFTQSLLSERFMAMVEKKGEAAVQLMLRELPGLYSPPDCPRCTRRALGRGVELSTTPRLMQERPRIKDRARFTANMAQLCAAFNRPTEDETTAVYWRALMTAMTDDEFERGVIAAVRSEKRWPTPATIAQYGKPVREQGA